MELVEYGRSQGTSARKSRLMCRDTITLYKKSKKIGTMSVHCSNFFLTKGILNRSQVVALSHYIALLINLIFYLIWRF